MKMCIFKKLKVNRVNVWHTCYLGVLRGAELESAVCPAQKWLIIPKQINKSKMAATAVLKLVNVHIFFTKQGRNMNEACFCLLSNMRQLQTQSCDKIPKTLLKTHINCPNCHLNKANKITNNITM